MAHVNQRCDQLRLVMDAAIALVENPHAGYFEWRQKLDTAEDKGHNNGTMHDHRNDGELFAEEAWTAAMRLMAPAITQADAELRRLYRQIEMRQTAKENEK